MDGPLRASANRQNGPPVWSGHVFGLLMRSPTDRWPRWVTRIGFQAFERALRRDDSAECPDPGPDLCAVAAVCSLLGDRPVTEPLTGKEKGCFFVRLKRPFLRPGLQRSCAPGAAAVKGRRRRSAEPARSALDGGETGARLGQVGLHQLTPPGCGRFRPKPAWPRRSVRSSPPEQAPPL